MINELIYWLVIVLIFLVSIEWMLILSYWIGEDASLNTREKVYKTLEPVLIEWFYNIFILFIILVFLSVGVAYLVLGSWPNWFFLSNGYIFRTLIVLLLAPTILKTILKIMFHSAYK